jgi:pimeloyl-ACP methyl ester carboxylesterase
VVLCLLVLGVWGCSERKPAASEPGSLPAPGTVFLSPERIQLEAGGLAVAERGVIFVPTHRARPESGVISLEIYRFKSTSPSPGVPPIFYLFGGPSFEGLAQNLARKGYYETRIKPLQDTADVVIVSQRGIGPSKPTTLIEMPPPLPLDSSATEAERAERVRENAEREKAVWTGQGLDLGGFTIVDAAADIDDVRRALGYERITLWGGSFGSHWAMAVMRFHPQIVERAILRGMEGPDHTYDMPSYVLNALKRIAAEADAAPALAGQIPAGGLMAAFEQVITRTAQAPVMVRVSDPASGEPVTVRFDAADVRGMATGYTASASSRPGMRTWASDVLALHRGDFTAAAMARVREQQSERFRTASYYMLDCGSGISRARAAQMDADPAVAIVGQLGFNYRHACPVWGADLGEAFRQNFETDIPTIISQGDYDISTPLENAQELAPFFTQGTLIVVHGGSHPALDDAMDASPEFARGILTFARTGDKTSLPKEVRLPPIDWVVPSRSLR